MSGEKDLADMTVTEPPAGWVPAVVEAEVDEVDATDFDVEADQ